MKLQRVAIAVATVAAGSALMVGTAAAETYVGGEVQGNTGTQTPPAAVAGTNQSNSDPILALTGTDMIELAAAGAGLAALGTVMVRRSRRVTATA
jgi:LPXTG-motif cell wall-anchored protein